MSKTKVSSQYSKGKFISIPHKKNFITEKKKSFSSAQGLKVAANRMEMKIGEGIKEYE